MTICKYCESKNVIPIELVKYAGYHVGEEEYHEDNFYLCKDCGKITVVEG